MHGLTAAFLADKPVFAAVAAEFAAFLGDARLVIHNAAFDMKFLNAELGWAGQPRSPGRGRSTRSSWRAGGFPGRRTASMRSAAASASTIPAARSTGRCSTPSCSPRSISS